MAKRPPSAPSERTDEPRASRTSASQARKERAAKPPVTIGCAERIGLPELGIPLVDAKVDTGARTTAIHATSIRVEEADGRRFVSFHVPLRGQHPAHCRAPLKGERTVRNTGGVPERRYVIRTRLRLGSRSWPIDVTLANRRDMRFAIILGRTALVRRRILIDPDHVFLLDRGGDPPAPDAALETTPGAPSDTPSTKETAS